eukprot:7378349-Prymnesium_polylepis.3
MEAPALEHEEGLPPSPFGQKLARGLARAPSVRAAVLLLYLCTIAFSVNGAFELKVLRIPAQPLARTPT